MFKTRKQHLQNIIKKLKKSTLQTKYSNNRLMISKSNHNIQYYSIDLSNNKKTYISKSNTTLIQELIQKDYEKVLLQNAEQELNAINAYEKLRPKQKIEDVFYYLHEARKIYISPITNSETTYINTWINQTQDNNLTFAEDLPVIRTKNNLRVRSKSELIIAETLDYFKIPYKYEYAHTIRNKIFYPDFTILDIYNHREIIWEHLGLIDDYQYMNNAFAKIEEYEKEGFYLGDNLIITWENKRNPFNSKKAANTIQHYILSK